MFCFLWKGGGTVLKTSGSIFFDKVVHPNALHDHGDLSIKEWIVGRSEVSEATPQFKHGGTAKPLRIALQPCEKVTIGLGI